RGAHHIKGVHHSGQKQRWQKNVSHTGSPDAIYGVVQLAVHLDLDRFTVQSDLEQAFFDIIAGNKPEDRFHGKQFVQTRLKPVNAACSDYISGMEFPCVGGIIRSNVKRTERHIVAVSCDYCLNCHSAPEFTARELQSKGVPGNRHESLKIGLK